MYPLMVLVIVCGVIVAGYAGYETVNTWRRDRKEQREYEEYVRADAEKRRYDDDDDDNEPLSIWKPKRDTQSELRHRNNVSLQENIHELPSECELIEMERSISIRKSRLEKEKEKILKEEARLQRKKELLRSKGNNITGVFHGDDEEQDPFADNWFMESSSSFPVTINKTESTSPAAKGSNNNDYHSKNPASSDNKSDLGGSWSDLNDA